MSSHRRAFTMRYLGGLFLACLIGFLGICSCLFALGREPIWAPDGLPQYLDGLLYEGRAIRQAVAGFLAGEGLRFDQFLFQVGYGADALDFLGVTFDDPLNLLSALCPEEYSEYLLIALIFVRMYLSGVTFSYYCLQRGKDVKPSFVGALCYMFCGYAIFYGILRHPVFMYGAITFPLLLAGADKVFDNRSPGLFVGSLALSLFLYIHQAYMECIGLLAYCLLRYFFGDRDRSLGDFLRLVLKFVLLTALAFCVAGIAVVPRMIVLTSLSRVTSPAPYMPLVYSLSIYQQLPADWITGHIATRSTFMGAIPLISVVMLIVCRRRFSRNERIAWIIGAALVVLCLAIPRLSSMLNGFKYPTDRWMFMGGFCFSYIACLAAEHICDLDAHDKKRLGIVLSVYLVLACSLSSIGKGASVKLLVMSALFVVSAALVLFFASRTSTRRAFIAVSCCILAGAISTGLLEATSDDALQAASFAKTGTAYPSLMTENAAAAMDDVQDDSVFRYSPTGSAVRERNPSLNHEKWGIDYYTSFYNQAVIDFRDELGFSDCSTSNSYYGSDARLAAELLCGSKYYVASESKASPSAKAPYSFTKTDIKRDKWRVWKTDSSLPIAFSTQSVINRETYDSLSPAQKQEALLQGVVIEGDSTASYRSIQPGLHSSVKPFEVTESEGLQVEDGKIVVLEEGATMTLRFDGESKAENYLAFDGLSYTGLRPSALAAIKGESRNGMQSLLEDAYWAYPSKVTIDVQSGKLDKSLVLRTPASGQVGSRTDWILNVGFSDKRLNTMTISFSTPGEYAFDSMQVVCQPVEPIIEEARKMAENAAEHISIGKDQVEAVFETGDNPELAVFTLSYSKGWSATVDGNPTRVLKADTAFLAVEVPQGGKHTVVLRYESPGFAPGLALSAFGLLAFVVLLVVRRLVIEKKPGSSAGSS